MKCFLLGEYDKNAGPSNVNRSLLNNSNGEFLYRKSNNRILRVLESIAGILASEEVLISGSCAPWYYFLLKFSKRKFSYLMHGCLSYENKINKLNLSTTIIDTQEKALNDAERIIAVSKYYAEWLKYRYPDYSKKITYVNNGISLNQREKMSKESFSVAVSGGNRCIKNNLEVSRAIKLLRKEGIPCKLYIFGRTYPDNDVIETTNYISYCGHLDKNEYYEKLDKISCFVVDSEVEPFGLVVADALNCNCSLLMSRNVGAKDVMVTRECDIIQDPHNISEIAKKLKYLFYNSNSDRLYNSIDEQECSEKSAFKKLKTILEGQH